MTPVFTGRGVWLRYPVQPTPPPEIDTLELLHTINNLQDAMETTQSAIRVVQTHMYHMQNTVADMESDFFSLIKFLEDNPESDVTDWARYEAVKEKLQRAAEGKYGEIK